MSDDDVLFEFVQVGQQMRVAAVDALTGVEVVVIAPLNMGKCQMQRLAFTKLQRRLVAGRTTSPSVVRGKFA